MELITKAKTLVGSVGSELSTSDSEPE